MATIAKIVFIDQSGKKTRSPTTETEAIEFQFANGDWKEYRPENLPRSMQMVATFHGLKNKLCDGYASVAGDVDAAVDATEAMWERLMDGDWTLKADGTGPLARLAEAIAHVTGQPLESVKQRLEEMDEVVQKQYEKHPQIVAYMKAKEAERAKERAAKAAAKAATDTGDLVF